jgi:diketogulonate reductase-like aldo/keto reductase
LAYINLVLPTTTQPVEALKTSLKKMKLDYVDLFLIHVFTFKEGFTLEESWRALEEAQELGLAKAIGVSNFRILDLERVLKIAKIKPVVNQIEFHPYLRKQTA